MPAHRSSTFSLAFISSLTALLSAHADPSAILTKSAIARINDKPDDTPPTAVIETAAQPIHVDLKTDKQVYHSGETIRITVKAERGGHARIFYRDSEGHVSRLFPVPAELAREAAAHGVTLSDTVAAGKDVVISGKGSATGISVIAEGPVFGAEEIAVLVTDFPLQEDAQFLAELEKSHSADEAARRTAALAIRLDVQTKSARAQLNFDGVPTVLTGIGLARAPITTAP